MEHLQQRDALHDRRLRADRGVRCARAADERDEHRGHALLEAVPRAAQAGDEGEVPCEGGGEEEGGLGVRGCVELGEVGEGSDEDVAPSDGRENVVGDEVGLDERCRTC